MSLPPWERGLKHYKLGGVFAAEKSLPPWERGLKHLCARICVRARTVACKRFGTPKPIFARICVRARTVAPPVGAWIETTGLKNTPQPLLVAPPVGAWIETSIRWPRWASMRSLPPWERGLKHHG